MEMASALIGLQIAASGGGAQGDSISFDNGSVIGFTEAGIQVGGGVV